MLRAKLFLDLDEVRIILKNGSDRIASPFMPFGDAQDRLREPQHERGVEVGTRLVRVRSP
jgi:hypothetical protein